MLQERTPTKLSAIRFPILVAGLLMCCNNVVAKDQRWTIGIETGFVWQNRNDVQIPGDTGTRFSLTELVGEGPFAFGRLELFFDTAPRHQLRFLIAPFRYTESGALSKDVFFVDQIFAADQITEATYQFNSYRLTYRYLFYEGPKWRWRIGATAKIRDAEIALRQGSVAASDSNVGFVPLLNLYGDYQITNKWRFIVDFDGLVGPQGRALDLGLLLRYDLTRHWYIGGGYRTLEGGADNDKVYNFGWFNYGVISAGYQF